MIPWRTILFLSALAFFVCFAGFNLPNSSDISFGFFVFNDIPVFISLFVAFILGAFTMLPFRIRRKAGAAKKRSARDSATSASAGTADRKRTVKTREVPSAFPDDEEF